MSWLFRDGGLDEAPIAFDLLLYLNRQRDFSTRAFGPGARTAGVIDHIYKELDEVKGSNGVDVEEWADVVILALDGALRAGFNPEDIATALQEKLEKNERRKWPDWRTADPNKAIEHMRVPPAMQGPDEYHAYDGPRQPKVVTEKRHTHQWVQHPTNPASRVCGGQEGCGVEL